jgi:hypothetical protein
LARILFPVGLARYETRKLGGVPQVSDTLATIPTGPSRDELKDSVDCLAFLRSPLLDRSQQHLVDGCQSPAVGFGI